MIQIFPLILMLAGIVLIVGALTVWLNEPVARQRRSGHASGLFTPRQRRIIRGLVIQFVIFAVMFTVAFYLLFNPEIIRDWVGTWFKL
jgi:hypothetical protein